MFVLLVIVALAVVAAVSLLLVGEQGRMPDEVPDREPADLPDSRLVTREDLDRVRFGLGLRGYRMDQVDAVLDRVATDLALLQEHVEVLEEQLREEGVEPAAVPVPVPRPKAEAEADDELADAEEGVDASDVQEDGQDADDPVQAAGEAK